MRGRVLREESGFTLAEVLVTMLMMLTVMFALYSIFDMSLRVFSFGNDKVEAVENARIGLAKMERELRAAYPEDKADGDETLFFSGTDADTIVFGNDIQGATPSDPPDQEILIPDEQITYDVSADGTKLLRNGDAAVEYVSSLNFDYQNAQGSPVAYDVAEMVEITLVIDKDGRRQTLSTDVSLRNRTN